jgi:hypothetical protein
LKNEKRPEVGEKAEAKKKEKRHSPFKQRKWNNLFIVIQL